MCENIGLFPAGSGWHATCTKTISTVPSVPWILTARATTHGYPDRQDEDGIEYWDSIEGWRVVDTEEPSRLKAGEEA